MMFYRLISYVFLFISPFFIHSQGASATKIFIDSLKSEIAQTTDVSVLVHQNLEIAKIYVERTEYKDSILSQLQKSLNLSSRLPNEKRAISLIEIGGIYNIIDYPYFGDSLSKLAFDLTENTETKVRAYLTRLSVLQPDDNFNKCSSLLDSAETFLNQTSNNQLRIEFYWRKGRCYLSNQQILQGLKFLLRAKKISDIDDPKLPNLLTEIGSIYDELEVFEKTLENGLLAQRLAQQNQDVNSEIKSIYAIISGAFALKQFGLVKKASLRANNLIRDHDLSTYSKGYPYYLLGRVALIENQQMAALDYFNECLRISKEQNEQDAISSAYEGLSMVYSQLNNLSKSLYYAELALEFDPPYISDRTLGLAQIFGENNDFQRAYKLLEEDAIKKLKNDSINSPSAIISSLLTDNFDHEKYQLENDLESERKLGIRNLLIGIFSTVILFLTFLYFYNIRKKRIQNQLLKTQVEEQTIEILKQKEHLQVLDLAKTRLYTNITHEFRTPLTVISGITDQLKGNAENKVLIKRNSDQLLNLINQMLDLQKIESGEISIYKKQGDIIKFLRYLTESLKSYAETKGLTIHFLSTNKCLIMDYDAEKITRIHSNLLSNAIKFTAEGGDIYIQIHVEENGGRKQFTLKIQDTGSGISESKLPYIFKRFYQVDDSSTRKGEGTGIGLTLVSELVKAMSGDINVNSVVNEGSTFTIHLPISNNAEMISNSIDDAPDITSMIDISVRSSLMVNSHTKTSDQTKPVVLVVEDNADVIHYLINCLKETYTIEIAMNGQEGIENAIANTPDIVVSDIMMPIKDGFELCQALKEDERTSHIPIVLLTAKADIESRLVGLKRGADAYLSKPFHQEELLIILRNRLALRTALEQRFMLLSQYAKKKKSDSVLEKEEVKQHIKIEDAFLQKIRALIEKDLSDSEIGMTQLTRGIGMSRSQIFKKVKALTGRSPSIYIRSIRLHHAYELLKNSDMNVSEVAYEVGFSSPVYFSDVFLEEFGSRPNEIRK